MAHKEKLRSFGTDIERVHIFPCAAVSPNTLLEQCIEL